MYLRGASENRGYNQIISYHYTEFFWPMNVSIFGTDSVLMYPSEVFQDSLEKYLSKSTPYVTGYVHLQGFIWQAYISYISKCYPHYNPNLLIVVNIKSIKHMIKKLWQVYWNWFPQLCLTVYSRNKFSKTWEVLLSVIRIWG